MATTADETPFKGRARRFLPIAIDTLVPTGALDFDLYIRPEAGGPEVMFRERTYPLETRHIERLAQAGVETLYIPVSGHLAYRRYLLDHVVNNHGLPPTLRYRVLRTANRAVFRAVFRSGQLDCVVDFANQFGEQMADLVCDQGLVLRSLLPLMAHDYYTYTHVTNVCTYCLLLAHRLGVCERVDLLGIATGALLHDLGKRHIPSAVLNQPGRLSEEQWELVRRHPVDGFRELCLRSDLAWGQLMMVYQHHERVDGRGYPVGVVGSDIHPWAKVCKVADVFDALSCDRPYRRAESTDRVLAFLVQRCGTEFDEETVRCLQAIVENPR